MKHAQSAAVVVGIDHYPDPAFRDLHGAVADARAMQALLVEHVGIPTGRIATLYDHNATATRIVETFDWLEKTVGPEGAAVFYFAGHGSRCFDASKDEGDTFDETFVPHDSGRGSRPNRDLTDDWLRARLERLVERAACVTLIFDSCHSGTLGRDVPDEAEGVRRAPDGVGSVSGGPGLGRGEEDLPYVLLAAAAADQLSHEREHAPGEGKRGIFTRALVADIEGSTADDSWRTIMLRVHRAVRALKPSQHPQVEGAARDRRPFSTARPLGHWAVADAQPNGIRVALGRLHGVEPDQVLELRPLPSAGADPEAVESTLRARVVDLGPLSCRCVPIHRGAVDGPLRALAPPGRSSLWALAADPEFARDPFGLIFDAETDHLLADDGAHEVQAGEYITLEFENTGGNRLHLALVMLDAAGKVEVVLPRGGGDFELAPFETIRKRYEADLPLERRDGLRWRLVLIASTSTFDARSLQGAERTLSVPPIKNLELALYRMMVRIVPKARVAPATRT